MAAKDQGGGSSLQKDSARGNHFPRQETAPPMDFDIGSELGDSGVESAGEGSGEEPSTSSGERRLRARRVRVARRWLDPHSNLENDWRKRGRHIQLLLDIDARLPNGGLIALKFLVETGALVNLIKEN